MAETVIRSAGEGDGIWMLGGFYEVKSSAAETDGQVTVMEMTIPPGMGPPPHVHPGGESVYVLEGALRYHIEGEEHEGGPGSFFYIPRGTLENFEPTGDSPLRILVIYTPGGIDRFFAEAGEPAQAKELPPPPSEPPDLERLIEIGERHGMEIRLPAEA
jgi:quercetin dioxygenase-like cupin family protein